MERCRWSEGMLLKQTATSHRSTSRQGRWQGRWRALRTLRLKRRERWVPSNARLTIIYLMKSRIRHQEMASINTSLDIPLLKVNLMKKLQTAHRRQRTTQLLLRATWQLPELQKTAALHRKETTCSRWSKWTIFIQIQECKEKGKERAHRAWCPPIEKETLSSITIVLNLSRRSRNSNRHQSTS